MSEYRSRRSQQWGTKPRTTPPAQRRRALEASAARDAWEAGRISPWRITAALDTRGLQGPAVDHACGVEEPAVDQWEAGQLYPTFDQLIALARLTDLPPTFFITRHGEEPLGWRRTSLVFHLPPHQVQQLDLFDREPVLQFDRAAIDRTLGRTS